MLQELQALLDAAENAHESQHTQLQAYSIRVTYRGTPLQSDVIVSNLQLRDVGTQEELWSSQRELRQVACLCCFTIVGILLASSLSVMFFAMP